MDMNGINAVRYPLELFSGIHFAILAVFIPAAFFLAFVISKKFGFSKKVLWVVFAICMLCEIEKILFFIEATGYGYGYRLPAAQLPFNMCPFMIFFIFILAISQDIKRLWPLLGFMFPMLTAGAAAGMVVAFAANTYHGLLDLATWRYFIFHSTLVFTGVYLYLSRPIQWTIREYGASLLGGLSLVVVGIWINAFFGWNPQINFLFLVRAPTEGLAFLNMDDGWLTYLLRLMSLGLYTFTFLYLPVIIRDTRGFVKRVREKRNTSPR